MWRPILNRWWPTPLVVFAASWAILTDRVNGTPRGVMAAAFAVVAVFAVLAVVVPRTETRVALVVVTTCVFGLRAVSLLFDTTLGGPDRRLLAAMVWLFLAYLLAAVAGFSDAIAQRRRTLC